MVCVHPGAYQPRAVADRTPWGSAIRRCASPNEESNPTLRITGTELSPVSYWGDAVFARRRPRPDGATPAPSSPIREGLPLRSVGVGFRVAHCQPHSAKCATRLTCPRPGSNRRALAFQASALPTELRGRDGLRAGGRRSASFTYRWLPQQVTAGASASSSAPRTAGLVLAPERIRSFPPVGEGGCCACLRRDSNSRPTA